MFLCACPLDTNLSLSLLFYFVKTERAIPKENHTRPEGWLCYSIEALLQSVRGWQCRQITDREPQREGEKPKKGNPRRCCQSLSQIPPPPLRTFNLFKLSWLTTFRSLCLSSEEVKCIWIRRDTQDVGKWFTFFFSVIESMVYHSS